MAAPADGTYQWYERRGPDGTTVTERHSCYKHSENDDRYIIRSRTVRDENHKCVPLVDSSTGEVLRRYDHYRMLRTQTAWSVPMLLGKLPRRPEESDSAEDQGRYAVFVMMLFRPWRDLKETVRAWAGCGQLIGVEPEVLWMALFHEFRLVVEMFAFRA